jgi:membrane fusion protein, multidrug efflux system
MLEQVKDDPEGLLRRKRFFELLDSGDPGALERWKGIVQRRQGGGQGGGERPAQ